MLAKNNSYIAEASATVYQLSQDEKIRLQCEAREDYYHRQAGIRYEIDMQESKIKKQNTEIEKLTVMNHLLLAEKEAWIIEREQLLSQINANQISAKKS